MHALKFAFVRTCLRLFSTCGAACNAGPGCAGAGGGISTDSSLSSDSGAAVSNPTGPLSAPSIGRLQYVDVPQFLQARTMASLTRYTSDSRSLCCTISRVLQPLHCSITRLAFFSESVMPGNGMSHKVGRAHV